MPLPDPHANEMTVELDRDKVKLLNEAKDAITKWTKYYTRLKKEIMEAMGDAFAGTVDGDKVILYRPKDQYAVTQLENDYPDLVEHFRIAKVVYEIDMDHFKERHPDIAEKYRVRAFVERAK
jgi:hypothetical protein